MPCRSWFTDEMLEEDRRYVLIFLLANAGIIVLRSYICCISTEVVASSICTVDFYVWWFRRSTEACSGSITLYCLLEQSAGTVGYTDATCMLCCGNGRR